MEKIKFNSKKELIEKIELLFHECTKKEDAFEKPSENTRDFTMTGKIIALGDANLISKEDVCVYRDIIENDLSI